MQTGELCSGDWSERTDTWVVTGYRYDATKPMVESEFSGANDLLSQFVEAKKINGTARIKQYLVDNLGIENLMACEPPTISNKNSYKLIGGQLRRDGDRADAAYIEKKLAAVAVNSDPVEVLKIKVDKAYLYDLPDLKAQTKMYLVRGDMAKSLEKTDDWIRIEYTKKMALLSIMDSARISKIIAIKIISRLQYLFERHSIIYW